MSIRPRSTGRTPSLRTRIMIVPTDASISDAKGSVLGQFIIYLACTGQQAAARLGYSPMPKQLVGFAFDAERRIPGAPAPPPIDAAHCQNPTITGAFQSAGGNSLAGSVPWAPYSGGTGGGGGGSTGGSGGINLGWHQRKRRRRDGWIRIDGRRLRIRTRLHIRVGRRERHDDDHDVTGSAQRGRSRPTQEARRRPGRGSATPSVLPLALAAVASCLHVVLARIDDHVPGVRARPTSHDGPAAVGPPAHAVVGPLGPWMSSFRCMPAGTPSPPS